MRVILTGAAGMLGQDFARAATAAGHEVVTLTRAQLDIADGQSLLDLVARVQPDLVVNCAAWTDVDGAESDAEAAIAVNGNGAGNVARAAAAAGAWTLHVSSDYVFDGNKGEPYVESDETAPISQYGRSKLLGERAVAQAAPDEHTIVRSSWLFGAGGKSFPATILRLAAERAELTVVEDQIGCPTFTGHLARALLELAECPIPGLLHVAGGGECSWHELALEIVSVADLRCEIKPGRTADLARPAPRPPYSVLRTERTPDAPLLPDWHQGIATFLEAQVLQ